MALWRPTIKPSANALGVMADGLLRNSVAASGTMFQQEAVRLLADCSHTELRIITEIMRT